LLIDQIQTCPAIRGWMLRSKPLEKHLGRLSEGSIVESPGGASSLAEFSRVKCGEWWYWGKKRQNLSTFFEIFQ